VFPRVRLDRFCRLGCANTDGSSSELLVCFSCLCNIDLCVDRIDLLPPLRSADGKSPKKWAFLLLRCEYYFLASKAFKLLDFFFSSVGWARRTVPSS